MMGFDIFILFMLLFTTIRGAAKGVAWQLAGIGALVLCFMFATPLSLTLAPMIKVAAPLNRWIAMLGIYLVFSFGTFAIARGFREALEKARFVEFDRHMGALFGLFKGAILALVITFFAVAMSEQTRTYILKTYTGYAAAHIMNALDPVMPKELHAILEPYMHELDSVDPRLAREREEFHDQLEGSGYRPQAGTAEDESGHDPFQDGQTGTDPFQNDATSTPTGPTPTLMEEVEQFFKSLPGVAAKLAPAAKQQIYQSIQNMPEEQREEFVDELSHAATPETVNNLARAWQNGRPNRQSPREPIMEEEAPFPPLSSRPLENRPLDNRQLEGRPQPQIPRRAPSSATGEGLLDDEDLRPERQNLLHGIASIFSSQPNQQARKMTEIETSLLGLPDPIAVGALNDWLSDLRGEDPDPDPETDVSSLLNVRIARQIDLQQMPLDRLPQQWQTRLERYLRN